METKILVFGLDESLAGELQEALFLCRQEVCFVPGSDLTRLQKALQTEPVDLIFCAAEAQCLNLVLNDVSGTLPGFPVVVVTRTPEVSQWLDAIESGAADYCAPPFEKRQIEWIVETNRSAAPKALSI